MDFETIIGELTAEILPMTVVKRFHDCLLPTWQSVKDLDCN